MVTNKRLNLSSKYFYRLRYPTFRYSETNESTRWTGWA